MASPVTETIPSIHHPVGVLWFCQINVNFLGLLLQCTTFIVTCHYGMNVQAPKAGPALEQASLTAVQR